MSSLEVTTDELATAHAQGAEVLDVRTDDEWATGRVPGARHIPLADLPARWEELPRDQRIYVVCAVGARSLRAAQALVEAGIDAVSVTGGTKQWIEEGREIEGGGGGDGADRDTEGGGGGDGADRGH
jgi:rhodanese-related sulfurtransferase